MVVRLLAAGYCLVILQGHVYLGDYSIKRIWFDHNTLSAPALFVEKADHIPYHKARMGQFRWMYNAGLRHPIPEAIADTAGLSFGQPVSSSDVPFVTTRSGDSPKEKRQAVPVPPAPNGDSDPASPARPSAKPSSPGKRSRTPINGPTALILR